jgi:Winged helix DNA-binding domain
VRAMNDAPRILSQRQLNRALLARQLLLERAQLPIPRVLERMGFLQAQYAPAMYVGLWSRIEDLQRDEVTRQLEQRDIIQATLLRATIHLVSRDDYWPTALAIRSARRTWWLRAARDVVRDEEMSRLADVVRREFQSGTLHRKDLDRIAGSSVVRNALMAWIDLVRVPPSGTWERRSADLFALAEDWVGPEEGSQAEGVQLLVRRYLTGFGPSSSAEIANWAGLGVRELQPALDALPLRRFRAEDGTELLDLPNEPLPDGNMEVPVRLLPHWDATLLVHARRTQILPEEHRPTIFNNRRPHSFATFLVDGQVAGTWQYADGRVKLSPFGPLGTVVRRQLDDEAERMAAFHA